MASFALKSSSLNPLSFLVMLLLMCFLVLLQLISAPGGIINGAQEILIDNGSSIKEISSNRKLLVVNGNLEANEEAVFSVPAAAANRKQSTRKVEAEIWELRAAPLGPDPLHHHGADPRKPRTP